MKTNGPICARTRHSWPVLALLITAPAFSQINFTSSISSLFAHQGNEPERNWKNYHKNIVPGNWQTQYGASALLLSSGGSGGATAKPVYAVKKEMNKSIIPVTEKNERLIVKGGVRFRPTSFTYPQNSKYEVGIANYSTEQLLLYAKSLKEYARKNGYDTTYALLGNMGMLCNKKRFFVVNLKTMQVETSGLVSHGQGTWEIHI